MAYANCDCGRTMKEGEQEQLEAAITAWLKRHPNADAGSVPQGKVILNDLKAPLAGLVNPPSRSTMIERMSESRYDARFGEGAWVDCPSATRNQFLASSRRDLAAALPVDGE